jgi:hypothetical protein
MGSTDKIQASDGNEFIKRIDDESFMYKKKTGDVDLSLPQWVILNPEPAPTVEGIDMCCGAEEGFFGPTNQENAVGAPSKSQYCCREKDKICWPEFASKTENLPVSDKGHHSPAERKLLPKEVRIRKCLPKDFVDTHISPEFVKRCIVDITNARAAAEGAGFAGTVYKDFEPFDLAEVYKMIGLLCVNGVLPCPRINMWFEGHNIFGNNLITRAMHKQLPRGWRSIRGIQWWKHFCCFMCMFVFCEGAKKMTAKNSLWKVQRLLDKLNDNAAKMWILGKWFSIDKQTLGFQGRIGIKLCISYKKEGDGFQFQCDAVCGDREKPSPSTSAMGTPPLSPLRVQEQDFRPITHSPACCLACSLSYECLVKNFHGQPFQLPEVVQGALLGKVFWARSCANHRSWSSTIGEAA